MNKVIYKFFWLWNYDQEDNWLNDMSSKGYELISVGCCRYKFRKCECNEYIHRIEFYNNFIKVSKRVKYISFIEETGVKYIGTVNHNLYFSKKSNQGDFEIYSDNTSKIKYLNQMLIFMITFSIINLIAGSFNLFIASTLTSYINPMNFMVGIINVILGLIIIKGAYIIYRKKQLLEHQKQLFE